MSMLPRFMVRKLLASLTIESAAIRSGGASTSSCDAISLGRRCSQLAVARFPRASAKQLAAGRLPAPLSPLGSAASTQHENSPVARRNRGRHDPPVEGCQAAGVGHRQGQQMRVGHLPGGGQVTDLAYIRVQQTHGVRPEDMPEQSTEPANEVSRGRGRPRRVGVPRIADHANGAVRGERARRPGCFAGTDQSRATSWKIWPGSRSATRTLTSGSTLKVTRPATRRPSQRSPSCWHSESAAPRCGNGNSSPCACLPGPSPRAPRPVTSPPLRPVVWPPGAHRRRR